MSGQINTTDEYIPCPDCNGEKAVEVEDCHVGSASLCCGGCTKYIPCETCDASGEIENPDYYPDEEE